MKIKEYFILNNNNLLALQESIVNHSRIGFELAGGVSTDIDEYGVKKYNQAMVKYEEQYFKPVLGSTEVKINNVKGDSLPLLEIKERRVVDVFHAHSLPGQQNIIEIRNMNSAKGWTLVEQGHLEGSGWYLKMVKYG